MYKVAVLLIQPIAFLPLGFKVMLHETIRDDDF